MEKFELYMALLILVPIALLYISIGKPWLMSLFSGVKVSPFSLIFMRLRNSPVNKITMELIMAVKNGVNLTLAELEYHHVKGGDTTKVVQALITAKRKNIQVTFQQIAEADLDGQDLQKLILTGEK